MSVELSLSKREHRLLTVALKTTVSRTPKSAGTFDRLVTTGLLGQDGRITQPGRQAISSHQDTPHVNSNDYNSGITHDDSHKSKYQRGDRRTGTRR